MALNYRVTIVVLVAIGIVASAATGLYLLNFKGGNEGGTRTQNVLIVASITGFNDSVDHGVPQNHWPVVHVSKGTMVNITVMNVDKQSHGFQIAHYYDNSIVTIAPGQTIRVSFLANVAGTFQIYCSIPCTVHWAMLSGELIVS